VSWRDAVVLAERGMIRRSGRAVLTVIAVALATTLLTGLLTIARTGETRVLDEIAKGGPLAGIKVEAAQPVSGQLDSDAALSGAQRDIDDRARRQISSLPGVASVVPIVAAPVRVVQGEAGRGATVEPFGETYVGVDLARVGRLPVSLLAGDVPAPGSRTEVAVTEGYLERVGVAKEHAADVVGDELELGAPRVFANDVPRGRWTRSTIVGVVAQEIGAGQVLGSLEEARLARDWTAASAAGGAQRFGLPSSPYSGLFVVAKGLDRVADVRAQITDIGFATSAPESLITEFQRYRHVVEIVLGGIGLIALVIAALGICNALLAAVRERTREIGVLKAIGARDRDVLRVFLVEATALGLAGGVTGAVSGWAVARAVGSVVNRYLTAEGLAGVEVGLPVSVLVACVAGAVVLALLAGAVPALRAARLPAREAVSDQ
jgi:putative ABC transport system permease protein